MAAGGQRSQFQRGQDGVSVFNLAKAVAALVPAPLSVHAESVVTRTAMSPRQGTHSTGLFQ